VQILAALIITIVVIAIAAYGAWAATAGHALTREEIP
jgi:hypothetical protein